MLTNNIVGDSIDFTIGEFNPCSIYPVLFKNELARALNLDEMRLLVKI
jgi:hypothetical protein